MDETIEPIKEEKLSPTLTDEENEVYAQAALKYQKEKNEYKIHPVVQIKPVTFERSVAFLKEPNYETKIRVMDKATTSGIYTAANELREACILKEISDPITYGEGPECDDYKMGITDFCLSMITRLQNQFKKK